tara:strand:+ start:106 stop:465 length:360 start_codon:yes stop_codon:yes gene_type:complete
MIIERVTESQFINAFKSWDTYKNHFSYEGLKALYEYFEEVAECNDSGTFELDVVAICCDFTEYSSFKEWKEDFSNLDQINYIHGGEPDSIDYYTTVLLVGDKWKDGKMHKTAPFIIQNF